MIFESQFHQTFALVTFPPVRRCPCPMRHLYICTVAQCVDGAVGCQSEFSRSLCITIILVHGFCKIQVKFAQSHDNPGVRRAGVLAIGRDVHAAITILAQVVTCLCRVEQRRAVASAFKGFYRRRVVVGPHIAVLYHGHAETRIQSGVSIFCRDVDGCAGMALPEGLARAVGIFVGIYQRLRGTHAPLTVLYADGIVISFPRIDGSLFRCHDDLYTVAVVGPPDVRVIAQTDTPFVGITDNVVVRSCGFQPPFLVVVCIEQGGSLVEQRACLQGQTHGACGTPYVLVQLSRVADGQVFSYLVQFLYNPVHDFQSRTAYHAVRLARCQGFQCEGHIAVGTYQFEIEESPQVAHLIFEKLKFSLHGRIVRIALVVAQVYFVQFLQEVVGFRNGAV